MPASGVLCRLVGVGVDFGAVRALDGVDLELRPAEVHALVGPNGSGKTTALRVLAGVVRPATGSVEVRGEQASPAGTAAPRVRGGVVRTPQHTAMLPSVAARCQVAVGARAHERHPFPGLRHLLAAPSAQAEAEQRTVHVDAALRAAGLDHLTAAGADVSGEELDSAEQRLLQLARAVATGAPALLLDEPAAGMSAPERERLGQTLRRLAGSGRGVLLVEHDMALVGRVADRVTVLAAGQVLATGTPEEIRRDPAVRRAYLGSVGDSATSGA